MKDKTPVLVAGYPKSGNTWLTRLLGDILDCPTGGSTPEEDEKEIATEGLDRPGPYVVRKGHYRLIDETSPVAVPRPHALHWRALDGETVFFIIRDPRDICVSGAYHWGVSIETFFARMIRGEVARLPPWNIYVSIWCAAAFGRILICYEDLQVNAGAAIADALDQTYLEYDTNRIPGAVTRQSFLEKRKAIRQGPDDVPLGKEFQLKQMRKGVSGDWRNHFNQTLGRMTEEYFGSAMAQLGYEDDPEWWKVLPK